MKKQLLNLICFQMAITLIITPSLSYSQVVLSEINVGEKPTINPGDFPSYNPSESSGNSLLIPSLENKPSISPTESTPSEIDLSSVPFGKPGNVHFHDSTKVEKTDGPPSTSKLELLDKHSDLDAEKVLELDTNELAEIDKIISDGGAGTDKAKMAVEIASRAKGVDGGSGDEGEKVLKLITDKNLDYNRLDKLDGNSLNLITKLTVDGNFDGETALKLAETGGEAGLKLATEMNLDLDKLSNRNANEISLINSLGLDADKATKALVIAETAGEVGLSFASDRNVDLDRLAARSANEIALLANIGVDDAKAETALGIAEIGGEIGLNLVKDRNLDLDRLAARTKEEMVLLSTIGVDDAKAENALSVAEKVGEAGLQLAQDVENLDIAKLDDFVSIESADKDADNTATLRNNLISNLSNAASSSAVSSEFNAKSSKILDISIVSDSLLGDEAVKAQEAKVEIFEKLAVTTDASGGTVNPIEQLVLLDSTILDKIASVDKPSEELAIEAVATLQNSAFASEIEDVDPAALDVHDINSIFNHYDKLEQTGLAGDENYEEVREQIASIIVLDVVSDNFKIEVVDDSGNESPIEAPLQFSDVSSNYGEAVLEELEGLTSSAEIVEEMNELNPSLFSDLNNDGDDSHHNEIRKALGLNELLLDEDNMILLDADGNPIEVDESGNPITESTTPDTSADQRRSSDTTAAVNPLTTIKEHQRDTVIDHALETYGSAIPVDKTAMQSILTPGSEEEEHHYEEALSGTVEDFVIYMDEVVPEELEVVGSTGQQAAANQFSNLRSRLSSVRLAQMGFPMSDGLVDAMVAKALRDLDNEDNYLAQANGSLTNEYIKKALSEDAAALRNGFYVQASASFSEDDLYNMDGNSWGITMGVDQEVLDGITFGVMGGIGNADSSGATSPNTTTEVDTDSLFGGIYGNYIMGDSYLEGYFTIGLHNSGTQRTEAGGAVLTASPNSRQYTASLTYGRVVEYEGFLITPHLGFTYNSFSTSAYSEVESVGNTDGTTSSASQMLKKTDDSFVASIGSKIAFYQYNEAGGVVIPEFRFSWEHDFDADPVQQGIHLLSHGADDIYYVDGRPEDSDYGLLGVGVTSLNKDGRSIYLHYDYMLGKSDFDAHFINLGFRILF